VQGLNIITNFIPAAAALLEELSELGVGLDSYRLHPFVEAPSQACPLVPGEVEAAAALQVLEEHIQFACPV
jgi:hypothetical protein